MYQVTVRINDTHRRFVVRVPRDRMFKGLTAAAYEYQVLDLLQTSGVPVPFPLLLDETRSIHETPYLAVSFIDGTPDYNADIEPGMIEQMAGTLADIHLVDVPDASFLRGMPEDIPEIENMNRQVLLHGDYWPGNNLWKNSVLQAVVDWEDASIGDPLYDLAITRHDVLMIYGADSMTLFTETYQKGTGFILTHLPYWDLYAAERIRKMLPDIVGGWEELGRPDLTEKKILSSLDYFIDEANSRIS